VHKQNRPALLLAFLSPELPAIKQQDASWYFSVAVRDHPHREAEESVISVQYVAAIGIATAIACQSRQPSQSAKADELVADFARDTTIIEQPDRLPDSAALSRLLDRIGIPFEQRLARNDLDCVTTGTRALFSPTISCHIRDGVEPMKLHIVADSSGYEELQVLDGTAIAQRIDLTDFERPDPTAPALFAEDLDGDEAREVIMRRFTGATGNAGFTVWRADPTAHILTPDSAMSSMTGAIRMPGRPCVFQSWNLGVYDHVSVIECYLAKQWKPVWQSSTESTRTTNKIVRRLKVMVRDTLRLIRADTLPRPE
jgi:hypothetical protein